jgi:hypothetical protein
VNNLPPLPESQQYQVWKITGEVPVPSRDFSSIESAEQLEILSANFFESDAIGMNVEPLRGSPQPPGAIVLVGNF